MPSRDKARRAATRRACYLRNRDKEKEAMRLWRANNPEKHRSARRSSHLRVMYGLTQDQFDTMLELQNGLCAICHTAPKDGSYLHVDHRHSDGVVRGLLCGHCNRAIGLFSEDPAIIDMASSYLRKHSV